MPNPFESVSTKEEVEASIDAIRKRLQCDVIDLLYLSWWDWEGHWQEGMHVLRLLAALTKGNTGS